MPVETITPPNPLSKARNGNGPVSIDPEILERAEKAVADLSDDYAAWAQQDIDGLRQALALARANPSNMQTSISHIYRHALDLKGQGGGFGYVLITEIGSLLTRFMEGRTAISGVEFEIVDAHIDALQVVLREEIKGDGGQIGEQIVAGLQKLDRRYAP